MTETLCLPMAVAWRNGKVIKGTSKYGIGWDPADAELISAVHRCDLRRIEAALQGGADINCIDPTDRVSTPILHAVVHGSEDVVKFLLSRGADPNTNNISNTVLMLAARFNHLGIVKSLIEAGADVNACDSSGGTALDNAKEHPQIVDILRQAGAQ